MKITRKRNGSVPSDDSRLSFAIAHSDHYSLSKYLNSEKYLFLHNSPANFFKSCNIIRHGGFFRLSWLGEECQGLGFRYLLKESRYLLFKRQNNRKMRRVFAWLPTFYMSVPYLCQILAQTVRLRKDSSKIINLRFFQGVCVYERLLEVKISGIINLSFSQGVCVYERLLEVKISCIYFKLKATHVFVFVRSAILDVSTL